MKTRRSTMISIFIIFIFIITMGIYVIMKQSEYSIVATIGDSKITKKDFQEFMVKKYGESVLEQMINKDLVDSEIKSKNITVSDDDIQKQLHVYTSTKSDSFGTVSSDLQENAKEKALTNNLIKTEIDETKIKTFFSQSKLYSENTYTVTVCQFNNHEDAMNYVNLFNSKKASINEIINKASKYDNLIFTSKENPYEINLSSLKEGESYHIQDMKTNKHLVMIVNKIQSGRLLDYTKDKSKVVDAYLDKYYNDEYLNLLDKLKNKYKIDIKVKL